MKFAVSDLAKSFPGSTTRVLDGFTCQIDSDALTFVTGPNGIGKTVFAKCISGLLSCDSGTIEFGGTTYSAERWNRESAKQCGIEYLPQSLPTPSHFSVDEFLALSFSTVWYRPRHIRAAVSRLGEKYGIQWSFRLDVKVTDLTPAELQELYIARALTSGAKMLILDEPTANLPAERAQHLAGILARIGSTRRIPIIVIAHPQQATFGTQSIRIFTPKGLATHGQSQRAVIPNRGDVIQARSGAVLTLRLSDNTEQALTPGHLLAIEGAPSEDFYQLGRQLSKGSSEWFIWRSIRAEDLVWRYIPPNAQECRLALPLAVVDNCLIGHLANPRWTWRNAFVRRRDACEVLVDPIMETLQIHPADPAGAVQKLSGGNRQRLVIGRECYGHVDVLIVCTIFKGLDDSGIRSVSRLFLRKAATGTTIIMLATPGGVEQKIARTTLKYDRAGLRA